MGRWEILESVAIADCAVAIDADDLDDLFATAARALADVMVNPDTVDADVEREVTLTAPTLDLLLYDWLSELIYAKDRDGIAFTHATARVGEGPPWRLTARVRGGAIDREGTERRADAKAVTLHQFLVERRERGWHARVVIDI